MKKNITHYFLIVLFFFPFLISAQTIIKERVKINPSKQQSKFNNTTQDYPPLDFQIGGALYFTATVSGPSGSTSGSGGGGPNPYVYLSLPAANGIYRIHVSCGLEAGQITSVDYSASWGGVGFGGGVKWLRNDGDLPKAASTDFYCTFSGIPVPPLPIPFDFGIDIIEDHICGTQTSDINAGTNQPPDSLSDDNIQLAITNINTDAVIFNILTNQIIGTSLATSFDRVSDYGIKLNSPYSGLTQQVKLVAYSNGLEKEDSLLIEPATDDVYLDADNYLINLIHGMAATLTIKLFPDSDCSDIRLRNDTKFNIEITSGDSLGHLVHPLSGEFGRQFSNLNHTNGVLSFDFIADGSLPSGEDTVYVTVSTTDPNIWAYDFIVLINEGNIVVEFVPESIMPGGTAEIVLKKREPDGTLTDFPQDQVFNVYLTHGKDYGTIEYFYRGMWVDTSDVVEFEMVPFKFIAMNNLSQLLVESSLTVSTYLDSGENIWGGGTILISDSTDTSIDTFYVKANFDRTEIIPGDTVNVIVKKVNKEGNGTDFPENTSFEVGIKEGCGTGNILTSNGDVGQYFINVNKPIRFIVNDSVGVVDTSIVLRIGVPSDDSTLYLLYDELVQSSPLLMQNEKTYLFKENKINTVTNQTAEYCIINPFEYNGFGLARAIVENIEIKLTLTGNEEIWPYLPQQLDGRNRGADRPGYNPFTAVRVDVIKGTHSLSGIEVKFAIKRVEGTGGHDHIFPQLPQSLSGKLRANNVNGNPIVVRTDINGKVNVDQILSSQFSGNYIIQAELVSNTKVQDAIGIVVKVPGLINFAEFNTEDKWRLVGALPTKHTDVHWCTQEMSQYMLKALDEFYEWSKTYRSDGSWTVLDINDMSLIWGGSYEYNADWNVYRKHSFHRVGLSVDINRSVMSDQELKKLTEIISKNYGRRDPERPQIHYGFLGGN